MVESTGPRTVAFRVDASLEIGNGHVMRCLVLADALRQRGFESHFLCRRLHGNLGETIQRRGHILHWVGQADGRVAALGRDDSYEHWLGVPWRQDMREANAILEQLTPAWVVVDHYALDAKWEASVRELGTRVFVIDDLANRAHEADALLDQNLGRVERDYAPYLPTTCRRFLGPDFALLKPEFAALRPKSLARRQPARFDSILVSMGGVDAGNASGSVLDALSACSLAPGMHVKVIMGPNAPWIDKVRNAAGRLNCHVEVLVNVSNMAELMTQADLSIGAVGSTSWERCCLGLPALTVVLASNQTASAKTLEAAGAVRLIGGPENIGSKLPVLFERLRSDPRVLSRLSERAAEVCSGRGADIVADYLSKVLEE